MAETLPVHVNRGDLHALEAPDSFEATGPFTIDLVNHGEAVHVHIHLDDPLSEVADIGAVNHYVDADTTRQVRVDAHGRGPVRGTLKLVAGYGAETRYVDVKLTEPESDDQEVVIDESLSHPRPEPAPSLSQRLARFSDLPVLALAGFALLLAVAAATVGPTGPTVLLGVLAVLAGIVVAAYLLVR